MPVRRSPRVHQFAAALGRRDAVSNHTMALHRLLEDELGCEAAVLAVSVNRGRRGAALSYFDHRRLAPPDLLIYQACTGSPAADYVHGRPEPLVIDYHNLTPPGFFGDWEPAIAAELAHGRRQLARLARRCRLVLADSAYSAAEMTALGAPDVRVAPVLCEPPPEPESNGRGVHKAQRPAPAPGPVWLFVGRLAPHKAQHDLIAALALYRELVDDRARLVLAGTGSLASYAAALRRLAEALGVAEAVDFAGSVPGTELSSWYEAADVFVCLSDHEGFCVPLVEAMRHGLPVIAFDAAAVPETLGPGGLLIGDKSPSSVAAAVSRVLSDPQAGRRLARRGAARLEAFDAAVTRRCYVDALSGLLRETGVA